MFDTCGWLSTVQRPSALLREVHERRARRTEIHRAINRCAERHRGIRDFADRADRWMPPGEELTLFLARQLATVSLENVGAERLTEWMALQMPVCVQTVEFVHDTWAANAHKRSLIALPVITHVRDDGLTSIRSVRVVERAERLRLSRTPLLSSINAALRREQWGVAFEGRLPDLHRTLRRAAGLTNGTDYDISDFWHQCVRATTKPPEWVFVATNGTAERKPYLPTFFDGYVRPPASWYYLLYLCLFLTGDRALLATTIEEDDESIRTLFTESIALLEREIGVTPLIVWMPHTSRRLRRPTGAPLDFTEIHPGVFRPGWWDRLPLPACDRTCYQAMDQIVHAVADLPLTE